MNGTTQAFVDAGLDGFSQNTMTFHAEVEENHSYKITLFDVGFMRGPSYGGDRQMPTTVALFTNSFVIGAHIAPTGDRTVSRALLNLGGISAFCDTTHIDVQWNPSAQLDSEEITIGASSQSTKWMAIDRTTSFRLISRFNSPRIAPRLKDATINVMDYIDLKFHSPVTLSKLSEHVNNWQSFLSFCLRRPSYVEEIRFSNEKRAFTHPMQLVIPGERDQTGLKRLNIKETFY